MTPGQPSSRVIKIGIFRKGIDIKLPVIPSNENWHLQKGNDDQYPVLWVNAQINLYFVLNI